MGLVRSGQKTATGTTPVELVAAEGGSRVFPLSLDICATTPTGGVREVKILDGTTVIRTITLPASFSGTVSLSAVDLQGTFTSASAALQFKLGGAGTDVTVDVHAWQAPGAPTGWGVA